MQATAVRADDATAFSLLHLAMRAITRTALTLVLGAPMWPGLAVGVGPVLVVVLLNEVTSLLPRLELGFAAGALVPFRRAGKRVRPV
jgi:hypothetical protein